MIAETEPVDAGEWEKIRASCRGQQRRLRSYPDARCKYPFCKCQTERELADMAAFKAGRTA